METNGEKRIRIESNYDSFEFLYDTDCYKHLNTFLSRAIPNWCTSLAFLIFFSNRFYHFF